MSKATAFKNFGSTQSVVAVPSIKAERWVLQKKLEAKGAKACALAEASMNARVEKTKAACTVMRACLLARKFGKELK